MEYRTYWGALSSPIGQRDYVRSIKELYRKADARFPFSDVVGISIKEGKEVYVNLRPNRSKAMEKLNALREFFEGEDVGKYGVW